MLCFTAPAGAIPPNTPITNTARVDYSVDGSAFAVSDALTVVTDPASGNSPPSGVLLTPPTVSENVPGATIGTLTVEDLDLSDTHSLTVSDPRFVIVGDELRLAPGVSVDFEAEPSISIEITATDPSGAQVVQTLVVAVADVNEPPTAITLDSSSVPAATPGASVGQLATTDPDQGDTHTYAVDDPRFEVVNGELRLVAGERLNLGESVTLTVTSTDSGGLTFDETFVVTAGPPGSGAGTDSQVGAVGISSVGGGQAIAVSPAQCATGGVPVALNGGSDGEGGIFTLPATLNLVSTDVVRSGSALLVSVTDPDGNADPGAIDQVDVLITSPSLDSETVTIRETGITTGIFVGMINTQLAPAAPNDCVLQVTGGESLEIAYTDASDPTDISFAAVTVDPVSRVFASSNGNPVNGARIELLDSAGAPAAVFAQDGLTPVANVTDSGDAGQPGGFRFPVVAAGSYNYLVSPPNRFAFPSTAADAALQSLPGAPFALSDGSRGQLFTVAPGGVFVLDVPLDVLPITPSTSSLELLAPVAGGGGEVIGQSSCFSNGQFQTSPTADSLAFGPLATPGVVPSTPTDRFSRGDAMLIRLVDTDQDLDPFAADIVEVEVTTDAGDVERVQLSETNQSTGIFTGYLQTAARVPGQSFNCVLEAAQNSVFTVSYADAQDAADTASATGRLDPGITLFASDTGAPIDGAEVTLIDVVTGLPADGAVFLNDGVTPFPATLTSGGEVTIAGETIRFAPGSVLFPSVAPGDYRLEVQPPVSYDFPSALSDEAIDAATGGAFDLVPASRGDAFSVVAGAAVSFDVPLDPVQADVFIAKEASKEAVAIGDFLQYRVTVSNNSTVDEVSDAFLVDQLPRGFRLVADSVRLNESLATADVAGDGETLRIDIGQMPPGFSAELTYVVEVTAGADDGIARNSVSLRGIGVGGPAEAHADVTVRDELFVNSTFIVGRVVDGSCDHDGRGLAGVRIWLEDGTFVVTDEQGKYHFEGVEPGTHVVQMDTATLPLSHEPVACERNNAFAGSAISQFVDLQAGALWRADFYASARKPRETSVETRLSGALAEDGESIEYRLDISAGAIALGMMKATVMLPADTSYRPGSARLNGGTMVDPRGAAGALTFKLPDGEGPFEHRLSFHVDVADTAPSDLLLVAKSVLAFKAGEQSLRSDVVTSEIGRGWPTTHDAVAQARTDVAHGNARMTAMKPATSTRSSARTETRVVEQVKDISSAPYVIPEQDRGLGPKFDRAWLKANQNRTGIVWPPERHNPVMPAIPVAVVHPKALRPHLLVDGEMVNALTLEGAITDHDSGVTLTTWDDVPISEADSVVEVQLLDAAGAVVAKDALDVHFSGAPARVEPVPELSYLVADGIHPPLLAVRLFDHAGYPLRAGTTGEFSVGAPYRALNKTKHLENLNNQFANQKYRVLRDGVAYVQLEPTVQTGEAELRFTFDSVRQETLRYRLEPGQRDWILVGLVEGTFSARDLGGRLEALEEADRVDADVTDGRVAFYAKGMVSGDWLLTVAYDTDKKFEQRLREQIDPNQFYTLYGDGTDQLYDAESQQKLYLKVERSRFAALFGDFDTEFSRSELARYERRVNGVQVGYHGQRYELKAFASDNDQRFVRDELRGDGTSGVYRLSQRPIVRNSEKISIVARDRFSPQNVVSTAFLTRFQDYTIDYDLGTVIFRQPVLSQDAEFNPLFIEAEYEVERGVGDEIVGGIRAAYRLDEQDSEVAVTYINDDSPVDGGELLAADFTWQYSERQKLTVEIAQSDTVLGGRQDAYLAKLEHEGEKLAGKVYAQRQEAEFGLGQQSIFERGVEKVGVEAEYRQSEALRFNAQAFEQSLVDEDSARQVVDARAEYRRGSGSYSAGLRAIREETPVVEGEAVQVTAGIAHQLVGNKLTLRADAEVGIGGSDEAADYPSRYILGAEYQILPQLALIAEQEFTFGDLRDTQDTRLGLRARPWRGGEVNSMFNRIDGENGERLANTTGVLQQWRINDRWLVDAGFDRVQTLRGDPLASDPLAISFNPVNPPASGSLDNDFTAAFLGLGYQRDAWNVASRVEHHLGDQSDKWNLLVGANRQLSEGRVVSGSLSVLDEVTHLTGGDRQMADLRFALAWRPSESRWSLLNRTDLILETRRDQAFDVRSRKWVNNTAYNYKFDDRHQLSVNLGLKHVLDTIDDEAYEGTTLLYGAQYRYFFHPRWDLGLQGTTLHSLESDVRRYSAGVSIGVNAFKNSWLSVGYNWTGFEDEDFVGADYTADGFYVKLRLKLDQALARRFLEYANLAREAPEIAANGR